MTNTNSEIQPIVMFRNKENQFTIPNSDTMCIDPQTGAWVDFEYIRFNLRRIGPLLKSREAQSAAGQIYAEILEGRNNKGWSIAVINIELAKIGELFILEYIEEARKRGGLFRVTMESLNGLEGNYFPSQVPSHRYGSERIRPYPICINDGLEKQKETSLTKLMEDITLVKKDISNQENSLSLSINQLAKLKAMLVDLV